MDLNLHRLGIFLRVVDAGSFSAAARKLHMSQPSVSNQVKQLETSVRATLVDRAGSRVRPTAAGEVLAQYARRILLLVEEAGAAVEQVQGVRAGRLRLGGTTTVGTYLLPALISSFCAEHPGVESDLVVGNSEQVEEALLTGDIGLAVLAGNPTAPQLVAERILTDTLVLCASPSHPLGGATGVDPRRLAQERFLLREPGSSTRADQCAALRQWRLDNATTADIWGAETIKRSVTSGLGITLMSEHAVGDDLSAGRITVIGVDPPVRGRDIVACHRRDRLLSPAESAFLTRLRSIDEWPA
ncbi:LysR family transcriptional regulator [Spiractinospora alimapuensis]|uniref:LysR family transcriptional regulator n=1 Tax=Spiractinospora alimapuensis TaxID=2820884 RepID=UPI001F1701FB|nr:LysR family transcriptional regulator [Spiractinospora alimapuensis]QVQ53499.1 LysR family transcriptional regulator [Spiractinospora alimapuensis]